MYNHSPTLLIVLQGSLLEYFHKGEIKQQYLNPGNTFRKVHVLSLIDSEVSPKKVQRMAGTAQLTITPIGRVSWRDPSSFLRARRAVRTAARSFNPDLVRSYDIGIGGYLATLAGTAVRKPVVVSLHIDPREAVRYSGIRGFIGAALLRYLIEPRTLRYASHILCVSSFLRQHLITRGVPRKTLSVIPNTVDLHRFAPRSHSFPRVPNILSVGRLDVQKYQECLIRAVQTLPVRLTLVGSGSKERELRRLCRTFRMGGKVHFISAVPHAQIHRYYQQADLFAIATKYEGFCIPVAEAMACGLPIVASDIPAIREVLGSSGLLVRNTVVAFRAALSRLLDDAALRSRFSRRARIAARRFDTRRNAAAEAAMYQTLRGVR